MHRSFRGQPGLSAAGISGPKKAALAACWQSPSIFTVAPKKSSGIDTQKTNTKGLSSVLELIVQHGEMLVMHGAAIHGNYVHKVEPHVTAREWEGQSGTWRIARPGIIDPKDREGKERENYLVGEMQALYSPPRR